MNKTWNDTIIEIIGTVKTGEDGRIAFKANQYGKYTATLKVAADSPWSRLARKNTFVFMDGLRKTDVDDLKQLEEDGEIDGTTRLVVIGHLVRTPGKPGMNDLYNVKTLGIRPATKNENFVVKFEDALSKEEWQVIRKERFGEATAPTAAPVAPSVPF